MKHENYEILNLIGYGLAKFDKSFVTNMGFNNKSELYNYFVQLKIADTVGTIKNRQDLFDPFFDNDRKGWWQKGNAYIHRKIYIDQLFGTLSAQEYTDIIKYQLHNNFNASFIITLPPLQKTKFRNMQLTGKEAEEFFIHNYQTIDKFQNGILEDARLFGDGYDFQITCNEHFYLAEIKGIRSKKGSIRITENEFLKAQEYKQDYLLTIISDLDNIPQITTIENPLSQLEFSKKTIQSKESYTYNTDSIEWWRL